MLPDKARRAEVLCFSPTPRKGERTMPQNYEQFSREDTTEEYSFGELAREVADGNLSRSRALKTVGAAVDGGTVLLADDNPKNAQLFVRTLRISGFTNEVVVVHSGAQALEYLLGQGEYAAQDLHAMPKLVVLDLNMPGMDGLEVLGRIRGDERTQRLPVVMISAFCTLEDVQDAYRLGANAFVDKASASVPFEELVREVAYFWLAVNEPPPASRRA